MRIAYESEALAFDAAHALVLDLGDAWQMRVWENLGWWAEARAPWGMSVHEIRLADGRVFYESNFIDPAAGYLLHDEFGGCQVDESPTKAFRLSVEVARRKHNRRSQILAQAEANAAGPRIGFHRATS